MELCLWRSLCLLCSHAGSFPFTEEIRLNGMLTLHVLRPLKAFWSPVATYPHTCIDEGVYMLTFSVITILLDFFLLLLPIPIVRSLQLSTKQRFAVCGLFFIGFIICISGIVHAYYVDLALVRSYDETWDGWPLWVASAIQVDLGIVSSPPAPEDPLAY